MPVSTPLQPDDHWGRVPAGQPIPWGWSFQKILGTARRPSTDPASTLISAVWPLLAPSPQSPPRAPGCPWRPQRVPPGSLVLEPKRLLPRGSSDQSGCRAAVRQGNSQKRGPGETQEEGGTLGGMGPARGGAMPGLNQGPPTTRWLPRLLLLVTLHLQRSTRPPATHPPRDQPHPPTHPSISGSTGSTGHTGPTGWALGPRGRCRLQADLTCTDRRQGGGGQGRGPV